MASPFTPLRSQTNLNAQTPGISPPPAVTEQQYPQDSFAPPLIPGLTDMSPSLFVEGVMQDKAMPKVEDNEFDPELATDAELLSMATHMFTVAAQRDPALLQTLEEMARTLRKGLIEPQMDQMAMAGPVAPMLEIEIDESADMGEGLEDEFDIDALTNPLSSS